MIHLVQDFHLISSFDDKSVLISHITSAFLVRVGEDGIEPLSTPQFGVIGVDIEL